LHRADVNSFNAALQLSLPGTKSLSAYCLIYASFTKYSGFSGLKCDIAAENQYHIFQMSRITFNNKTSPFFDTLKSRVEEYFSKHKLDTTGNYKLYTKTAILSVMAIGLYVTLVFFTPPVFLSVMLCILMGFTLAGIGFNVMHDGAHGSYSKNKTINELMAISLNFMGGSSYMWKIKHNLIHHSYTNIEGMDDDIDIKPFFRVNEQQPKYWFHRFQHVYWVFLYGVTYFFWVFWMDFDKYFRGKIGVMKVRKMSTREHIGFWTTKIFYILISLVIPIMVAGVGPTLTGYAIILFICGLTISVIFQLAHVVEDADFPEPNPVNNKIEEEWAVHQIRTTVNFSTRSAFLRWFTGGLNFQIEHHLFPKISHVHYPAISRLVRETCAEFGVAYNEYPTLFKAIRSHVLHLKAAARA
jgi:linoleoyl-CoA desaturase